MIAGHRMLLIAAPVIASMMLPAPIASTVAAQSANAPRAVFDAASVKLNTSGDPRASLQPLPGGRFTTTNLPIRAVIRFAYDIQDFHLEGGPGWLVGDRYDIVAKAEGDPALPQIRMMVQSLLADRFGLRVHSETRELPAYALVLARSDRQLGTRLRHTAADCTGQPPPIQLGGPVRLLPGESPCGYLGLTPGSSLADGRATMAFRGMTIDSLARFLMPMLRRMVVDRTDLSGYFDGDFDPSAEFPPPPPPPGVLDPFDRQSFPTIFTVLREQLGLKLDNIRAPTPILVIDQINKPTED
jgi:uncharacterized protein (TIGR03435 family)